MSKIVNGLVGPVEQPIEQEFQPNRGLTTHRRWECTNTASASALMSLLSNIGWTTRLILGPKPIVEASTGGDGTTEIPLPQNTDSWELSVEEVQKDFLEADIGVVNVLSGPHLELLKSYMTGEKPYAAFTPAGASADNAEYLWLARKSGFKTVTVFQPVFKIHRTVDRGYPTTWNYTHINGLVKTSTLKAESFAPSDFLVSLDQLTAYYGTAPSREAKTPYGIPLYLVYAWKKHAPSVELSGFDKKTITQQYTFGLWDIFLDNNGNNPY